MLIAGTIVADQYRIERPIGEGGMGVVYLARDTKLDRDVAVKLCAGLSPSAVHRIQREAMALAKLAHPNVVVVFQAGELDGRFFIAMEYVAGGTAASWVAACERGVDEIVALYAAAGDGLAAAHAAGLVHRDFKPDNVLVGADGRPRVADFGLVEAADTSLDARADQLAFAASLSAALRSRSAQAPRHVVAALQRALAEDREQRWPNMPALLAELRRDPDARRRRLFGLAGAVVLVGTGVVVASAWSHDEVLPCTDAATHMAATWNDERSATLADVVGEQAWPAIEQRIEQRTADWIAQHTAACEATRIDASATEEVLDRRMLCLDGRRRDLHAIVSVLEKGTREAIANAAFAIDLLPAASTCLEADVLGTEALPSDPALREQIARAQDAVAAAGAASLDPGALDALAQADDAVASARSAHWRPILAEALAARGVVLYELQRNREAMTAFEEALHVALASGSNRRAAQVFADSAWALADLDRLGEAEQAVATARALWERTGSSPELGQRVLGAAAHVAAADGRVQDALAATTEQIALATQAYGAESTSVAINQYNLALALEDANRRREATEAIDRAIDLASAALGDDHPRVARYMALAAHIAVGTGDLAKASELAGRALALQEAWFGPDDSRHVLLLGVLADVARRRGEYRTAIVHMNRALELRRLSEPGSSALAEAETNIAVIEVELGEFVAAAARVDTALATLAKAYGPDSANLVTALLLAGYIARVRPDHDLPASLRHLTRALGLAATHLGPDSPDAVNLEIELGNTLVASGQARRAVDLLEPRLTALPDLELPAQVAPELRLTLASALAATGERDRACTLAAESEDELRRIEILPLVAVAVSLRAEHCR